MTSADENCELRLLEAILFTAGEPLSVRQLAARMPDGADVRSLLRRLSELYQGRGINLVVAGETWAFQTAPDLGPLLVRELRVERKLSRAAVETLAIIAYHQPVTRGEIEEIRGVQVSKGTLDVLFEQGWVAPRGRREAPGRPTTWGTTDDFLRHFGFASLRDLPRADELRAAGLLDTRPAISLLKEREDDADSDTDEAMEPLEDRGA